MHYLIKQEKCGKCANPLAARKLTVRPFDCLACQDTGIIETRVSADEWLLERLKSLRWDDCTGRLFLPQHFDNPRFKEA